MANNKIIVRGAREHNLRNVDLDLPRHKLIVFTGVSGSGKSSLAFDTLFAEGQRRYVESLSTYARQFLGQMQKPDVDYLGGLSPSISIQQKTAGRNPRSTVGTITEIHDYLRVLFARVGKGHCPECGRPIQAQTSEQIIDTILAQPPGSRLMVLAPVVREQKGEFKDLFADMLRRGFLRARVNGEIHRLTEDVKLDRRIKHNIEIVVDRLTIDPKVRSRLAEAVEQALGLGEGTIIVSFESVEGKGKRGDASQWTDVLLSADYACTHCGKSYEPPTPQMFSFNSPQGMCPECDGLGESYAFDPDLLVPDCDLSVYDGAVQIIGPVRTMGRWRKHIYRGLADTLGIDLKKPWSELPEQHRQWLLYGAGDKVITYEWRQRGGGIWRHSGPWEGIIPQLMSSFKKAARGPRRAQLEKYMRVTRCPACHGDRLNAQARAVRVADKTICELSNMPISRLAEWLDPERGELEKSLTPVQRTIAEEVLKELRGRVGFLMNVGLHYVTLARSAPTLSGGEAQRIRLAGQIGSGLVGVLYILDEPSIGLHPRDNDRLLASLQKLRDMGNTVIVVEHDEDTMRAADYIVDFGPGPGVRGGEVIAAGSFRQIVRNPKSLTGRYLSGKQSIEVPRQRRPIRKERIVVHGARHHNLKNITAEFPIGAFICVTGVSGSGKSSLVNDILREGLRQRYGKRASDNGDESDNQHEVGEHDRISGVEHVDKVIDIDQSPIGRTPRSNPATYIKVFDLIRQLYAKTREARIRGYKPGRFSFNVPGGRCEACEGNGANRLEMDFLADIWVTCPVCEGKRFNHETLQIRYRGKNIHEVLQMDVQEALEHFANVPRIRAMLQTLHDVGLDYLKLGQPSPTLSGGEAQRIKLARELVKRSTGRTLYILDEPTTGLHFDDIRRLLQVLHGFVDAGNTVIVIEHNLEIIKTADWVIDLGPEGGEGGGRIVCAGRPEDVAACKNSYTGEALRRGPFAERKTSPRVSGNGKRRKNSEPERFIAVQGAWEHNLKGIDVQVPRNKMTVCCGPSGSGKSSFALDTVYAEGRRRYVESLSSYARQFLGQVQKPKVEQVRGLSPAVSIEQKTTSKSPRSTVGTVTEIYDYLRVLFARVGHPYCPRCEIPIGTQTTDEIVDKILSYPEGTRLYVLAPVERKGQGKTQYLWDEIRRMGFIRIRVDGCSYDLDDPPNIDHRRKHTIEVVVDRVVVRRDQRGRIADSVEAALELGRGVVHVAHVDREVDEREWQVERFSQHLACQQCGRSFEHLTPHHFSFNNPLGWCPACEGLGYEQGANPAVLIRDSRRSLREGAVAIWPSLETDANFARFADALARHLRMSLDTPFDELTPQQQRAIFYGTGDTWIEVGEETGGPGVRFQYKGLLPALNEAARVSFTYRRALDSIISEVPCSRCQGSRLRADAAAYRFKGLTIGDICSRPLQEAYELFKDLSLPSDHAAIAGELIREIRDRLRFLVDVGLHYLTLSRATPTLSGGESQRIRLAGQIGSGLSGVLYVLDEPTIGLHPRDNRRLLRALQHLRSLGNTLLLVEHDREIIAHADHLLDFGPGAGIHGGEITAKGSVPQVRRSPRSLTGKYLSGKKAIAIPKNRRLRDGDDGLPFRTGTDVPCDLLVVRGARQNNLKNIDVAFPLGAFIAVTGVSGSGKSSLLEDILYNALARRLHRAQTLVGAHDAIEGIEHIAKVINVDQNPLGSTPASNPATYTGVFDQIRELFARLPEAKIRGYQPRRFSFNRPGGRCEDCEGNGKKRIEMHFLPDVWVECETCHGKRYSPETLAIRYKGKSIADVLEMTVAEALEFFANFPTIRRLLQTLVDVGLRYLPLGQPAPTLSGGEAQRVKLAAELGRPNSGRTVYLLDEPTTGLHFDDIRKLLEVLQRLVDMGNTVIVVEHNLDVIKSVDWVIDLGPEGGDQGGRIVVAGTPERVASSEASHTGGFLHEVLKEGPYEERPPYDPHARPLPEDETLEALGEEVPMPWETDGKKWHTEQCVAHSGKRCRWDGRILTHLDKRIHELGDFAPTLWNHRSVIEIAAKVRSRGWFLHAMTGQEWYVRLVFRVGRNTFRQQDLEKRLALPTFASLSDVDHYSDDPRVQVANRKGPWQEVVVLACKYEDVTSPAFEQFLEQAAASFANTVAKISRRPEDHMPWKVMGERWHLGPKGFPVGKQRKWDLAILPQLLDVLRSLDAHLEFKWDSRDSIRIGVTGVPGTWARLWTKRADALVCRFKAPKGLFNLDQLGRFGDNPQLDTHLAAADTIGFFFRQQEHLHVRELKELLQRCLRAYCEMKR